MLDQILENMAKAMEADNLWDSEAYAIKAINFINNDNNKVNPERKEELLSWLNSVVSITQQEDKRRKEIERVMKEQESFKNNLIEQIVNFKPNKEN